jgi:transcriptional regulator with XRE-family HTH domain
MVKHPLKEFRDSRGLTQPELAKELGVSTGALSRWESGARVPRTATLRLIVEKTGISPAALLGMEQAQAETAA